MKAEQIQEELTRIIVTTWEMVAGLNAEALPSLPTECSTAPTWVACVHINGDWLGTVSLECSEEHAKLVVQKIFGLEADQASDELIDEALRELVNMTGGNVKSMLGERSVLSVPKCKHGRGFSFQENEATELACSNFAIGTGFLTARVYHSVLNPFDVKSLA